MDTVSNVVPTIHVSASPQIAETEGNFNGRGVRQIDSSSFIESFQNRLSRFANLVKDFTTSLQQRNVRYAESQETTSFVRNNASTRGLIPYIHSDLHFDDDRINLNQDREQTSTFQSYVNWDNESSNVMQPETKNVESKNIDDDVVLTVSSDDTLDSDDEFNDPEEVESLHASKRPINNVVQ